jgi:hypothetical protein
MDKSKVGTGKLEPFKKGDCHSKSVEGSTNQEHVREGFCDNVMIERASANVSELTPFETGPSGPGRNQNQETVPDFKARKGCGIDWEEYKPFKP